MQNTKIRRTQAERSERTIGLILTATLDSIYELGFVKLSTNEVARRAGISRGAMLHHFPTKEALISAAVEKLLDEEILQVRLMAGAYQKKELTLEDFVDFLWERFSGRLFMITIDYLSVARTDDAIRAAIQPVSLQFNKSLNEIWTQFFLRKDKSAHDVEVLLNTTLCLMRGMGVQTIVRKDKDYFNAIIRFWKTKLREALSHVDVDGAQISETSFQSMKASTADRQAQ